MEIKRWTDGLIDGQVVRTKTMKNKKECNIWADRYIGKETGKQVDAYLNEYTETGRWMDR